MVQPMQAQPAPEAASRLYQELARSAIQPAPWLERWQAQAAPPPPPKLSPTNPADFPAALSRVPWPQVFGAGMLPPPFNAIGALVAATVPYREVPPPPAPGGSGPAPTPLTDIEAARTPQAAIDLALQQQGRNPFLLPHFKYRGRDMTEDLRAAFGLVGNMPMTDQGQLQPGLPAETADEFNAFIAGYVDTLTSRRPEANRQMKELRQALQVQAQAALTDPATPLYRATQQMIDQEGPAAVWNHILRPALLTAGSMPQYVQAKERQFAYIIQRYQAERLRAVTAGQTPPDFQTYLRSINYRVAL